MFRARKALSQLELLVMDVVWQRGPVSTADVCEALARKHAMKESTARTVLQRLEQKGYAKHQVDGRTNYYSGVEPPANVAARAVGQIIERFCGGSVEELLVGMVDNEILDSGKLSELARKIARRRTGKET
ncbi:MAG: BlaI/MecI/CopY family transcriptional regulator [Acidobacteria bacterium]|nr:BlaI/MecI/CopY family transcriptional regulator [Acidobacteriota bacterium]